jgi:hypothetical protein
MVLCICEAVQKLIGEYQKMFLPSRQMTEHIRALNKLFYEAVQGNQEKFVLFMDNRRAFDSIHHEFIFAVLEKQGFPSWVIAVVKNLMEGAVHHRHRTRGQARLPPFADIIYPGLRHSAI